MFTLRRCVALGKPIAVDLTSTVLMKYFVIVNLFLATAIGKKCKPGCCFFSKFSHCPALRRSSVSLSSWLVGSLGRILHVVDCLRVDVFEGRQQITEDWY